MLTILAIAAVLYLLIGFVLGVIHAWKNSDTLIWWEMMVVVVAAAIGWLPILLFIRAMSKYQ